MNETQETINEWANNTFGVTSIRAAFSRFKQEVGELKELLSYPGITYEALGSELADCAITLFRIAGASALNLQEEIDKKMKINRSRKWTLNGDGIGQHK